MSELKSDPTAVRGYRAARQTEACYVIEVALKDSSVLCVCVCV